MIGRSTPSFISLFRSGPMHVKSEPNTSKYGLVLCLPAPHFGAGLLVSNEVFTSANLIDRPSDTMYARALTSSAGSQDTAMQVSTCS